jgi:hypothetical protein
VSVGRGGLLRVLGIMGLLSAGTAYTIGTRLESNDTFCASCHVEPETTYVHASLNPAEATTLAAFHAGVETNCIDCHSRKWFPGRLWAHLGGLKNLVAYASARYRDPSVTTRPVGDPGCSKCHSDLTWVNERPGHYHSPWLRRRWQTEGGPLNTCEVCHPSHEFVASADAQFMDNELIEQQCEGCHDATGTSD